MQSHGKGAQVAQIEPRRCNNMHRFSFDAQCAEEQWLAQYHKPDCADQRVDEGDWSKDHASIGPSSLWTARKRQGGWTSVSRIEDAARQCPCVLRNCESPYLEKKVDTSTLPSKSDIRRKKKPKVRSREDLATTSQNALRKITNGTLQRAPTLQIYDCERWQAHLPRV